MTVWTADIPVKGSIQLPPDPRVMDAIGANHALETALADLIDNSIDAGATQIRVRFIRAQGKPVALYVADDGAGMSPDELRQAMVVGGQRAYESGDLGHFGWGLKAASLSQADSVTVVSKTQGGTPVGMRWLAEKARAAFECDLVDDGFAQAEWEKRSLAPSRALGTVVRWDRVRRFPSSGDQLTNERWLQDALSRIQRHLGLVFHRFLQRSEFEIVIDVEDADLGGRTGPPNPVHGMDPMGYPRSGAVGYPSRLGASVAGHPIHFDAHIWPGRSELPEFRLGGVSAIDYQGFYFYRSDRLIQTGGWNGVELKDRRLQLARVAVEITDELLATNAFRMNPEKTRVEAGSELAQALEIARSDTGIDFVTYLNDARTAYKLSNRRNRRRERVVPPGRGFAPRVRKAIESELELIPGEEPIDIWWVDLPWEIFIDIDRANRVLQLNQRYRSAIIGDRKGGLNDAAVVKALVFLLMQNVFRGAYWGAKDKDNIELWQSILTAAARSDLDD